MSIRAAVLTYNEAGFVGTCLESIRQLTEDIVVIDSRSTDETVAIARRHGARIIERDWTGFASTRNFVLDKERDVDWLFFVDADERITAGLAREIAAQVDRHDDVDGYWLPRRNVVCGRIMRGSGWWPDYQLRLMRPGRCGYPAGRRVHEWPHCHGTTLALNNPLLHLNYRSWREYAAKQFAYAALAADDSALPRKRELLSAPTRLFWNRLIPGQGYKDGLDGLTANVILSASEARRVWLARRNAG